MFLFSHILLYAQRYITEVKYVKLVFNLNSNNGSVAFRKPGASLC